MENNKKYMKKIIYEKDSESLSSLKGDSINKIESEMELSEIVGGKISSGLAGFIGGVATTVSVGALIAGIVYFCKRRGNSGLISGGSSEPVSGLGITYGINFNTGNSGTKIAQKSDTSMHNFK